MAEVFVMPRGVYKKPENRTAREEIASVIAWARAAGFRRCSGDPRIAPLTRDTVLAPIQWGDQHSFRDIVAGYASAGLHCDFPTRLRAKKVAWAVYLTKVR